MKKRGIKKYINLKVDSETKKLWKEIAAKVDLTLIETLKQFGDFKFNLLQKKFDGSLSYLQRDNLPEIPGVYFVFTRTNLLYIGQTSNLFRRFHTHSHSKEFEKLGAELITWLNIKPEDLKRIEGIFIYKLEPDLNHGSYI